MAIGASARVNRRALLMAAAALAAPGAAFAGSDLQLRGQARQGGYLIGRAPAGSTFALNRTPMGEVPTDGVFFIGFDRDEDKVALLTVTGPGGPAVEQSIPIAPVAYDIQRIDGLPRDQVTPSDPTLLARIAAEAARKKVGFSSRADRTDFTRRFDLPVSGARLSARFGGQRILNGNPMRPHYGDDLAAPIGTPVHAPAGGVVCFAETGLHYEGALVLIDHGQGAITDYLHLSRVDVQAGQTVAAGEVIGAVGMEGRATGPHLCWRMKWRDRNLDPMLLTSPALPVSLT